MCRCCGCKEAWEGRKFVPVRKVSYGNSRTGTEEKKRYEDGKVTEIGCRRYADVLLRPPF